MWWEPAGEREQLVRQDVEQLTAWFREWPRDKQAVAWGVGSAWNEREGGLSPFIVLNAAHLLYSRDKRIFDDREPIFEPFWARELQERGFRLPETRLPLLAAFAYRPMPAGARMDQLRAFVADQIHVRDYVICRRTGERGTAGVRVRNVHSGELGLLTAGHVFPDGPGSEVGRRRWRRLGRLSSIVDIGRIARHIMPQPGREDWDTAIIAVGSAALPRAREAGRLVGGLDRDRSVFAHGARSGFLSDAIVVKAALSVHGDERYRWKNCWLVTPGGVLRSGDSGAAVFTVNDQALLGLYVGSALTPRGYPAHHLVQDAASLRDNVLTPWGYEFC